jgi:hypothetical protein
MMGLEQGGRVDDEGVKVGGSARPYSGFRALYCDGSGGII